jgi:hypothetical protein
VGLIHVHVQRPRRSHAHERAGLHFQAGRPRADGRAGDETDVPRAAPSSTTQQRSPLVRSGHECPCHGRVCRAQARRARRAAPRRASRTGRRPNSCSTLSSSEQLAQLRRSRPLGLARVADAVPRAARCRAYPRRRSHWRCAVAAILLPSCALSSRIVSRRRRDDLQLGLRPCENARAPGPSS